MEPNDYSWFIYALSLLLTLSICFIIILIIVKCAETCYDTRIFCCRKMHYRQRRRQQQRRQRRQQTENSLSNRERFDQENRAYTNNDSSDSMTDSSLDEHSHDSDDELNDYRFFSESNRNSNSLYTCSASIRQQQNEPSIILIPGGVYNNLAFGHNESLETNLKAETNDLIWPNSKINRKYDDKNRHANKSLPTQISIHRTMSKQHPPLTLNTISNNVDFITTPAAILAIDLSKTASSAVATSAANPLPILNSASFACLNLRTSNSSFIINTGQNHLILNRSSFISSNNLNNSNINNNFDNLSKIYLEDDDNLFLNESILSYDPHNENEVPPPYDFVIKESIV
jgi:hypothetical protein